MVEIKGEMDYHKKEVQILKDEKELLKHVLAKKTEEGDVHMWMKVTHVKEELDRHYQY